MLIDRATFPSTTLSTHFFRGEGFLDVVDRAGLLSEVERLGAPRLTCEYNYAGGGTSCAVGAPQDPGNVGYCMSIRREPLDAVLLNGARKCGAEVLTSTRVDAVMFDDSRSAVGVHLADGRNVQARLVVGADGLRSLVAAQVGAVDIERSDGARALYYRYVRGMPGPRSAVPDGPEFSGLGDELAYVFPSDADLTCVALSINLQEYDRFRHDAATQFDALLRRHRGVWPRYDSCSREGRLLGSGPQPDYIREAAGPGWALVGDSGIHQDPWTGLGIDNAAISAELLVDAFMAEAGADDWQSRYRRERDRKMLEWFHFTVQGAADLSASRE